MKVTITTDMLDVLANTMTSAQVARESERKMGAKKRSKVNTLHDKGSNLLADMKRGRVILSIRCTSRIAGKQELFPRTELIEWDTKWPKTKKELMLSYGRMAAHHLQAQASSFCAEYPRYSRSGTLVKVFRERIKSWLSGYFTEKPKGFFTSTDAQSAS